jgi:hypothetical protein
VRVLTARIRFKIGRNLVGFCHHDHDIADSVKWPSFFSGAKQQSASQEGTERISSSDNTFGVLGRCIFDSCGSHSTGFIATGTHRLSAQ